MVDLYFAIALRYLSTRVGDSEAESSFVRLVMGHTFPGIVSMPGDTGQRWNVTNAVQILVEIGGLNAAGPASRGFELSGAEPLKKRGAADFAEGLTGAAKHHDRQLTSCDG
jgi:hypothetical protein